MSAPGCVMGADGKPEVIRHDGRHNRNPCSADRYFQPSDWLACFWFMFNLLTSRVFGVDFGGKFSIGRNYPPPIERVHTMAAFLFGCVAWYVFVAGLRRETHRNGL
jgi:hypothetical protein